MDQQSDEQGVSTGWQNLDKFYKVTCYHKPTLLFMPCSPGQYLLVQGGSLLPANPGHQTCDCALLSQQTPANPSGTLHKHAALPFLL
jgi:hypothetical protein